MMDQRGTEPARRVPQSCRRRIDKTRTAARHPLSTSELRRHRRLLDVACPDDLYHPEKIAAQMALMQELNASVSYGSWVNIDSENNETGLR